MNFANVSTREDSDSETCSQLPLSLHNLYYTRREKNAKVRTTHGGIHITVLSCDFRE